MLTMLTMMLNPVLGMFVKRKVQKLRVPRLTVRLQRYGYNARIAAELTAELQQYDDNHGRYVRVLRSMRGVYLKRATKISNQISRLVQP